MNKIKLFVLLLTINFSLFTASAQQLWGSAKAGGATGNGTMFASDSTGNNFHLVYSFVNATGQTPIGTLVKCGNGDLYGCTQLGGYGDSCTCYKYDCHTGIFYDIHDFAADPIHGETSYGGMMLASDGKLYGTTYSGGTYNKGVVFSIDPNNNDLYTDIHDFNDTLGSLASGVIMQANDGKLYGFTGSGGLNGVGVIFSINISNNSYSVLYDFSTATGASPYFGRMIQATNNKLYGLTQGGGANGQGVIFSFDITNNTYADIQDFDATHGSVPYGSVIQATDGKLYGLTSTGGYTNQGIIFSYDIGTSNLVDLYDFNSTSGYGPQKSLMEASTGKLFGTTLFGGADGWGSIFNYDITTSTFTKIIDMDSVIGEGPDCDLLEASITSGIPSENGNVIFGIYPNPASDMINIQDSKSEVLEFTDVLGNTIAKIKTNSIKTTIDISTFPNIFFVKTQSGDVRKLLRSK